MTDTDHATAAERPTGANRYDRLEWAGAFGDLGTLIPFVVAYISLLGSARWPRPRPRSR